MKRKNFRNLLDKYNTCTTCKNCIDTHDYDGFIAYCDDGSKNAETVKRHLIIELEATASPNDDYYSRLSNAEDKLQRVTEFHLCDEWEKK